MVGSHENMLKMGKRARCLVQDGQAFPVSVPGNTVSKSGAVAAVSLGRLHLPLCTVGRATVITSGVTITSPVGAGGAPRWAKSENHGLLKFARFCILFRVDFP